MPTQSNLMGAGCPALQAQASVGMVKNAQVATGASQNALALISDFVIFTSGTAANGPTLPATGSQCNPGDTFIVVNHSGNSINVWPPTGGTVSTGATNAALAVPNGKTAWFLSLGSGAFAASVSA